VTHPLRPTPESVGRRLALTPIGLDVVAALGHDPDGLRLTPLADVIGSPVSSVQAALRILMANGLVSRTSGSPPTYHLADHPARTALVDLSVLLLEPAHTLGIILRASRAVAVSAVDLEGFVAGLDPTVPAAAHDRLRASLDAIAAAWPDAPSVHLSDLAELDRMAAVSVGLRTRLNAAVTLKGRPVTPDGAARRGTRTSVPPARG
jgi:hypothetical protein